MVTHGFAASEMNSFSQWKDYYKTGTTESDSPPRFRRARRHRNSRRHLHRPLPTRFTNDFDLLQAILARQIVPANNCNADQGRQATFQIDKILFSPRSEEIRKDGE